MAIEFRCPKGHRLSCPDDRAGLMGRCPKCKAIFQVPEIGVQAPAPSDSQVETPELADSSAAGAGDAAAQTAEEQFADGEASGHAGAATATADGAHDEQSTEEPGYPNPAAEERIVFLCPSGHKLNCPASMQGKPGKCPHCGATFLVPEYEPADDGETLETADDEEASYDEADMPVADVGAEEGTPYEADNFAIDFGTLDLISDDGGHPMAQLFQKLWPHKQTGGIVELYLKGGEVIAPEWFAKRQSQDVYGMFAFPENDGFTLTAIQWDAIERIAVRGVSELPPGMFDVGE